MIGIIIEENVYNYGRPLRCMGRGGLLILCQPGATLRLGLPY